MKVGVIGAGQWGRNLIRSFYRLGVLLGVAEGDEERKEAIAQEYPDIPVYQDYRELLSLDLLGVVIATPAPTHYSLTKEALLAGKDVFVEKPFTLSRVEAQELVDLAEREGRILMVGHLLLYDEAIQWIKDYIGGGNLGSIAFLTQERLKFGRIRNQENVLWSFGVHDITVLLYLLEEVPEELETVGQGFVQGSIEDDVYVHFRFHDGIHAHLHVSWLWPEVRRNLTVVGTKGMLAYNEGERKVVLHRKSVTPELVHVDEGDTVVFEEKGEPLLAECVHFLECIAERKDPLSSGRSAIEVIGLLERIEEDLRRKRNGREGLFRP